ncbi:hypothetical protein M5K25_024546 [Dendrobium thyrsiflorum]|uniref:Uncharacterized protein n=1 Tax=Dendrobium thyrsiflorum TaxID=117978 RepID=A0ABD0U2J8_DENTH
MGALAKARMFKVVLCTLGVVGLKVGCLSATQADLRAKLQFPGCLSATQADLRAKLQSCRLLE